MCVGLFGRRASSGVVTTGGDGWTTWSNPNAVFYVAAAPDGNNANDGLSPTDEGGGVGPKLTGSAAYALTTDGQNDWVLFRRGDTFAAGFNLTKSGLDASNPMLIGAYGSEATAMPIVQGPISIQHAASSSIHDIAVAHLHFDDAASDVYHGDRILYEGVWWKGVALPGGFFMASVDGTDAKVDITLRRCVIQDAESSGLFTHRVAGFNVIECVFDGAGSTDANHAMYISRGETSGVVTRGNLVNMRNETDGNGIMQRPGGLAEDNVIVGVGWDGITMGACGDSGETSGCEAAVTVELNRNLVLERHGTPGSGFRLNHSVSGETLITSGTTTGNAVADDGAAPAGAAFNGFDDIDITSTDDNYYAGDVDPGNPGDHLLAILSGSTTQAFFTAAANNRKGAWDAGFTAAAVYAAFRVLHPL